MKKYAGILIAIIGIGILGFNIGATAKNEENLYPYLLPLGMAIVAVGVGYHFYQLRRQKSDQ